MIDRRADGALVPSFKASERELVTLAQAVRDGGGGLVQILTEFGMAGDAPDHHFGLMRAVAMASGQPVTFTLAPGRSAKAVAFFTRLLDLVWAYNESGEGPTLHTQFAPRPIGMLASFDLTSNPWVNTPSYKRLAHLPLPERIRELRKPEVKEKIFAETPDEALMPLTALARQFDVMFELAEPPCYEPRRDQSVTGRAEAQGLRADEMAYDLLLGDEGRTSLLVAVGNYIWQPELPAEAVRRSQCGDRAGLWRRALRPDLRLQLSDLRSHPLGT